MRPPSVSLVRVVTAMLSFAIAFLRPSEARADTYLSRAKEVTASIQEHFWDRRSGLYAGRSGGKDPDMIWGCGVMFSALVGASRHEKSYRPVMRRFFDAMDAYWDVEAKIPGYEPARTRGGNDKYYDDNAWMVLTFLEAHELTGESRYLKRAEETLRFVVSGWDEEAGGGIWWHEQRKNGDKNTCVNAPAALGCFRLARLLRGPEAERWNQQGEKIAAWTVKTLQAPNGLFSDSINVASGRINRDQLTYNAGLMLRVFLSLHARTGQTWYLDEAIRMGRAAESLATDGVYRDPPKWAHLMVEADLELHRRTADERYLQRATRTADAHYEAWKKEPPADLITQASLARELWLLADRESPEGRAFWEKSDRMKSAK